MDLSGISENTDGAEIKEMLDQVNSRIFDRIIFHVDMDSFYASCEISKHPELKEKPFIVGADPKEGRGRGVVIACNYVARSFGVRSALPISRAWELCPQAVYVRPNFEFYMEVSRRVLNQIRQFADRVEQVSIDEGYLDVTKRVATLSQDLKFSEEESIVELAKLIKKAIRETEGITCSIGVARSKIVAKIATDMNKPDGLTIVAPTSVKNFLTPLSVSKIPGVGRVTQGILESEFSVKTIADLRKVPIEDLAEKFGKSATWLLNVAEGIDENEVIEHWDPVSLSSETTFEKDEADYTKVREVMFEVAKDVHKRATSENYHFRNVGIKIRFTGFQTHTRSKSLIAHTDSLQSLEKESEKLLSEFYLSGRKVRLIGVRLTGLEKQERDQSTLLDWELSTEQQ